MSELTDLCARLETLALGLGRSVEQLHTLAHALDREAEALRGQMSGGGRAGRSGQSAVDALMSAARAGERSAQDVASAARAGLEYARRNASGRGAAPSTSGSDGSAEDQLGGTSEGGFAAACQDADREPGAGDQLGPYLRFEGQVALDAATIATSRSRQGGLGDCGLIAACDGLRRFDPAAVAGLVTAEPDGRYTIHLHAGADGGAATDGYSVSGSAPERAAGSFSPSLSTPVAGRSWVTLVEKALAARKGCYDELRGIDPAEVLTSLTGRPYRVTAPPGLETIATLLQRSPVIAGTRADPAPAPFGHGPSRRESRAEAIVPNHWYNVVAVAELVGPTGSTYEIILENPWGEGHRDFTSYLRLDEATFLSGFDVACYAVPGEGEHERA